MDGIGISGNSIVVENSWLHGFRHCSVDPEHSNGSHDDGLQIERGSGIRITGNSIGGADNAAIVAGQGLGSISDLRITSTTRTAGSAR